MVPTSGLVYMAFLIVSFNAQTTANFVSILKQAISLIETSDPTLHTGSTICEGKDGGFLRIDGDIK